jgi:Flp pilus assembly protein TadG
MNRGALHVQKRISECGSAMLFIAAIVLPFLCILLSLSLDIAMYLHEEREVQLLLDKGGLYVQRYLPYLPEAESAFASYIDQYPLLQRGATTMHYDPGAQIADVLTFRYQRHFEPFFANIFGSGVGFDLIVLSQVRVSPLDVVIALDASTYLAPPLTASQGWNHTHERPAWLFQNGSLRHTFDFDDDGDQDPVDPLVATQACFSPAFLPLKRSAVRLYQYLGSFRDNAITLRVNPAGPGGGDGVIRAHGLSVAPGKPSKLDFVPWAAPVVRNEHCAAAAEREPTEEKYVIPEPPKSFEGFGRLLVAVEILLTRQRTGRLMHISPRSQPKSSSGLNPFGSDLSGAPLM